jgi:hypothetical protein
MNLTWLGGATNDPKGESREKGGAKVENSGKTTKIIGPD